MPNLTGTEVSQSVSTPPPQPNQNNGLPPGWAAARHGEIDEGTGYPLIARAEYERCKFTLSRPGVEPMATCTIQESIVHPSVYGKAIEFMMYATSRDERSYPVISISRNGQRRSIFINLYHRAY